MTDWQISMHAKLRNACILMRCLSKGEVSYHPDETYMKTMLCEWLGILTCIILPQYHECHVSMKFDPKQTFLDASKDIALTGNVMLQGMSTHDHAHLEAMITHYITGHGICKRGFDVGSLKDFCKHASVIVRALRSFKKAKLIVSAKRTKDRLQKFMRSVHNMVKKKIIDHHHRNHLVEKICTFPPYEEDLNDTKMQMVFEAELRMILQKRAPEVREFHFKRISLESKKRFTDVSERNR